MSSPLAEFPFLPLRNSAIAFSNSFTCTPASFNNCVALDLICIIAYSKCSSDTNSSPFFFAFASDLCTSVPDSLEKYTCEPPLMVGMDLINSSTAVSTCPGCTPNFLNKNGTTFSSTFKIPRNICTGSTD